MFRSNSVLKLVRNVTDKRKANQVFALMNLELWMRMYLDGESPKHASL